MAFQLWQILEAPQTPGQPDSVCLYMHAAACLSQHEGKSSGLMQLDQINCSTTHSSKLYYSLMVIDLTVEIRFGETNLWGGSGGYPRLYSTVVQLFKDDRDTLAF